MADIPLLGDMRERADGGFDGWCWAPDRPDERLIVDLLVNDTVAASMVAAIFRRDLMTSGYGDGRHGFSLRLPPNLPEAQDECLITARERRSGAVFGRVLRQARGIAPVGGPRMEQAAQSVAELWEGLAAATPQRQPTAGEQLRMAFGQLGARLAAGPRAAPPILPRGATLALPDFAAPALSVVLPVRDAGQALRQIASLAGGMAQASAEIIVVDTGEDPFAALLPAQVRHFCYLRDPRAAGTAGAANLAAGHARGGHLVVLGTCPAQPSAAALLALARVLAEQPQALALGPAGVAAAAEIGGPGLATAAWRLPGRLGLSFGVARGLWDELGPLQPSLQDGAALECADLAFRAALLGIPVMAVAEPAPEPGRAAASPAVARRARAAFGDLWGTTADSLDRRDRPA